MSPNLTYYRYNKVKGTIRVGHVLTVDPMINLGGCDYLTWGDNWTDVTNGSKHLAQFEHTILVMEGRYKIFTMRDDDNVMVWDA